ncbi:hypothetical protein BGZ98_001468 [Dissophora globulifera]|nr:hypothetical protein BGZ98_001468 [Dissophora globulifera]
MKDGQRNSLHANGDYPEAPIQDQDQKQVESKGDTPSTATDIYSNSDYTQQGYPEAHEDRKLMESYPEAHEDRKLMESKGDTPSTAIDVYSDHTQQGYPEAHEDRKLMESKGDTPSTATDVYSDHTQQGYPEVHEDHKLMESKGDTPSTATDAYRSSDYARHGYLGYLGAPIQNKDPKPVYSKYTASPIMMDEKSGARSARFLSALENNNTNPMDCENVIVIGKTGSGKSSIISLLLGRDIGVGHGIYSKTTDMKEYDLDLPAEYGGRQIKLIDTRGILDTEISLTEVLESLINGLDGRFYHVNTIMLVLECARFTQESQDALESLIQIFGLEDIERSRRFLVAVTKTEHLPVEKQAEVRKSIIGHRFFKKFRISEEYLKMNTIDVFAGQSKGVHPKLVPIFEEMRAESRATLLEALSQKNKPLPVSQDFVQRLSNFFTNFFANNVQVVAAKLDAKLERFLQKNVLRDTGRTDLYQPAPTNKSTEDGYINQTHQTRPNSNPNSYSSSYPPMP